MYLTHRVSFQVRYVVHSCVLDRYVRVLFFFSLTFLNDKYFNPTNWITNFHVGRRYTHIGYQHASTYDTDLKFPNFKFDSWSKDRNSSSGGIKLYQQQNENGVGEAKSYQRLQYPAYNWLFCALYIALHGVEVEIGTCLYQPEVKPNLSAYMHRTWNNGHKALFRGWVFIPVI